MKSTIKIFAVFAMLVGFTTISKAQTSQVIGASANVQTQITITDKTDVNFGNVQKGTGSPVYLDPQALLNKNVATTAVVGTFTINGSNSKVTVKWPTTIDLSDGLPTPNTLVYTTKVVGATANTKLDQNGAAVLGTPDGTQVTLVGGKYYIWIGGNVGDVTNGISSSQANGQYTGSMTFSVEYN